MGLHFLINAYRYYKDYKKRKTEFLNIVQKEIESQNNANVPCIWEFNEEYFRYKDYQFDAKMRWEIFKRFRIIEKNLFMDLDVGNNSSYILGQNEVGEENFLKVTKFVESKIG